MTKVRFAVLATILASGFGVSACSGPSASGASVDGSEAASAIAEAGIIQRLGDTRWAPNRPSGATAPSFVVDPSWPKPLPNNWRIAQVGGVSVDRHDNVWVYHRPRSLGSSEARAMPVAGTNANGVPVSGVGHPRPNGEPMGGCCVPAPSVLKFDAEGNLLAAWGGPADPGFLEEKCRQEDGCFWPSREHGIFVDHNDFVYVSGNGQGGGARQQQGMATYPWATTFGDDSHLLKFTADGEFIWQMGMAGFNGPDSEKIDGGPNGTPQPYLIADMSVDPQTNRLYIADGYGNRRILVADAETGQYIGHFGAYGQNPVIDDPSEGVSDTEVDSWTNDYRSGNMKPAFFRSPLHCANASGDGFLYACDRGNNRVQIFNLAAEELGKPCSNPTGEVGRCGFVGEIYAAPYTESGTAGTASLSTDPGQTCVYVGDLANGTLYIINRENLHELDRVGRLGRQAGEFHWLHSLSVDSRGNIYTGEVDTGQRVQKFLRYGPESCSGTGSPDVGNYQRNR